MVFIKSLRLGIVLAVLCITTSLGCSGHEAGTDDGKGKTPAAHEHDTVSEPQLSALDVQADAASGPRAYIISPRNGARVSSTFKVIFGLSGMGVAPAGLQKEGTGHHHLLIDVKELPPVDRPLPSTDNIRHFGNGQTETVLTLSPGKHTLQLLLADFAHIPHSQPVVSEIITVTVGE